MKQSSINNKLSIQNYENIFNIYQDSDDFYFYNLLKKVDIPADLDGSYYEYYTVKANDTWPTISYKFYKSVKLWWIICSANQIINPVAFPEAGKVIKIPTQQTVQLILSKVQQGG